MNHVNQWSDIPVQLNQLLIEVVYRVTCVIIFTGCVLVSMGMLVTMAAILARFLDMVIGKPKKDADPSPDHSGDQGDE